MSDDWFSQFLNDRFRPYMMRDKGGNINKGLDYLFTPEQKNRYKYEVSSLPFVGSYYKWQDMSNYWQDYMDAKGLSWADVKYPTMMMGSGQALGNAMRDVGKVMSLSKTAGRLYEGLSQDQGDWTPSKQPERPIRTNIGIRGGRFYNYGY